MFLKRGYLSVVGTISDRYVNIRYVIDLLRQIASL
jgi:hypothetical protein